MAYIYISLNIIVLLSEPLIVNYVCVGISRKLARSFSIFTNLPAVLRTDGRELEITCMYGLRVLSISWVVLANTYLYTAQSLAEVPVAREYHLSSPGLIPFSYHSIVQIAVLYTAHNL